MISRGMMKTRKTSQTGQRESDGSMRPNSMLEHPVARKKSVKNGTKSSRRKREGDKSFTPVWKGNIVNTWSVLLGKKMRHSRVKRDAITSAVRQSSSAPPPPPPPYQVACWDIRTYPGRLLRAQWMK